MTDISRDGWEKDAAEARALVRSRFPDFRCVRCENDNFLMRVWRDEALSPAFPDDRVVEYICDNCGFVERHVVAGLAEQLGTVRQRIKRENG